MERTLKKLLHLLWIGAPILAIFLVIGFWIVNSRSEEAPVPPENAYWRTESIWRRFFPDDVPEPPHEEPGDIHDYWYLGLEYFYMGDGAQAIYWLTKAAKQGHVDAQSNLGWIYLMDEQIQDYDQARYWMTKAAENGEPGAMVTLGYMYSWGRGVRIDYDTALFWFRLAAEENFRYAEFNMGTMYEGGLGVEIDLEQALYWYKRSAVQGHPDGIIAYERLTEYLNIEEAPEPTPRLVTAEGIVWIVPPTLEHDHISYCGLNIVQAVDSTKRNYWDNWTYRDGNRYYDWYLTDDAFHGKFALMYNGEFITDFIFDGGLYPGWIQRNDLWRFNAAPMSLNGMWGTLDKHGNILAPFMFERINYFDNSRAIAVYDSRHGLIDRYGNTLVPFLFDDIAN
ncbi:MAG: sel1 repeat family protein [Defluviitaleaceae bacterium]|nr:sel1 repeat family protein [Defluviitaleaceae bacterium]